MTLQTEGEAEDEDVPTLYETFWPLLFLRRRLRDGKARYRHLERLYGHTIVLRASLRIHYGLAVI